MEFWPRRGYPDAIPRVPKRLLDTPYAKLPRVPSFELTSKDVATGRQLGVGQASGNISPQLSWFGFPRGTRSFMVGMYDPDAPTGCGFCHWLVYDIPVHLTLLPTGAGSAGSTELGGGIQAANDLGKHDYTGAAPPAGQLHRYFITVTALNVGSLGLPPSSSAAIIGFTAGTYTLARATLVPVYRSQETT